MPRKMIHDKVLWSNSPDTSNPYNKGEEMKHFNNLKDFPLSQHLPLLWPKHLKQSRIANKRGEEVKWSIQNTWNVDLSGRFLVGIFP